MTRRRNFPFSSFGGLTGLDFMHRLGSSITGFKGSDAFEFTRQLQSSMTAFKGGDVFEFTRQLQSSVTAFKGGDASEFARRLRSSMNGFSGSDFSGITRQLQSSITNLNGLAGRDIARQLQSSMMSFKGLGGMGFGSFMVEFKGLAGKGQGRQFQSSMMGFKGLAGVDLGSQFQSSMQALSGVGQLGTIGIANGLLGPTAALSVMAGLTDGSFQKTSLAGLFRDLGRIAEMDAEAEPSELEQLLFDLPTWSELAARLGTFLKTHHVALVLFLLAAVHAQVLFALSQHSSNTQSEEAAQHVAALSDELREQNQETVQRMEQFANQLESALEQVAALQQSLAASVAENADDETEVNTSAIVEHRVVTRSARVHVRPKRNSAVVARVPAQESIFVFEHRRKWLYIGYSDVVTGRPVAGWVRKKYTRRTGSPDEVLFGR